MTDHTREGGAILVFAAVTLLILMGVAAIAVDLANGWSTRRAAQAAADVGAVGALQEIPGTFATSIPPVAETEVDALVAALTAVNSPGATATAVLSADFLSVSLDIDAESRNSFARAIGAGATIGAGAEASAMIEIPDVDKLLPIGFQSPTLQPYQCFEDSVPHTQAELRVCKGGLSGGGNGKISALLWMNDLATAPPCAAVQDVAGDIRDGVDHFVDTIDTGLRSEADACSNGHVLTMPTTAARVLASSVDLGAALIGPGAPLAGATQPLWGFLNSAGTCDEQVAAGATLDEQSNALRDCIRLWNPGDPPLFVSGTTSSPRFGWGADIDSLSGPIGFEEPTYLFLHLLVSSEPGSHLVDPFGLYLDGSTFPPGETVGAFTVYSLREGMLSSSDRDGLLSPFGTDELEFLVTD